jgi:fatty acid/phospholipid biosynthesis enzyme
VKAHEAHACVSAGNTGALMAMAHFVLKMLPGVERPAIVSMIPSRGGHTYMLDLGANASCTPAQLCQFGVMGSVLAADLEGAHERPRVGLLNIGEEEIKGNDIVQAAHNLLAAGDLNYVGFVEGHDIFSDKVDVVVTDGFTGNVALKTMEGAARSSPIPARGVHTQQFRAQARRAAARAGARMRAAHAHGSQTLQWRHHGRLERHRHQEPRRRRSFRISACHRGGGAGSAQRRAGAHRGTAGRLARGLKDRCTHASPAPAAICRKRY